MVLSVKKEVNGNMLLSIEKDQYISFMSQYELSDIKIIVPKISANVGNKRIRKNTTFIRIGTKSSSSYVKATQQFNLRVLPPLIKVCQLSLNFLNSIIAYISDTICWFEVKIINDSEIERYRMHDNSSSIRSKSSSTPPDHPPLLQSTYPILDYHNINIFTLKYKPWILYI